MAIRGTVSYRAILEHVLSLNPRVSFRSPRTMDIRLILCTGATIMEHVAQKWTTQIFAPLPGSSADASDENMPVVYISMSLMRHRGTPFRSIQEFGMQYERVLPSGERQITGVPDFDHFVLLLPPSDGQDRQVKEDTST